MSINILVLGQVTQKQVFHVQNCIFQDLSLPITLRFKFFYNKYIDTYLYIYNRLNVRNFFFYKQNDKFFFLFPTIQKSRN